MLTDLRGVNAVIQPMSALQPGLPSPSMIPANWLLIILDLKDCFFTIPLHPEDKEKFASPYTKEDNRKIRIPKWVICLLIMILLIVVGYAIISSRKGNDFSGENITYSIRS